MLANTTDKINELTLPASAKVIQVSLLSSMLANYLQQQQTKAACSSQAAKLIQVTVAELHAASHHLQQERTNATSSSQAAKLIQVPTASPELADTTNKSKLISHDATCNSQADAGRNC